MLGVVLQRRKLHVLGTSNDPSNRAENEQGYAIVNYLLYLRVEVEGVEQSRIFLQKIRGSGDLRAGYE